jgi:protoporphyrinogen/coproporphyrinogen III oxidase
MNTSSSAPVAIIGAGIAGLTAAVTLRRQNIPVVLFESGPRIAGLAQSFQDQDGFSYDFGAHFITNRLAAALGIGAQCNIVRHYGETVWLRGKSYGYPFGLLQVPRFSLGGLATGLTQATHPKTNPRSAADWFRAHYGNALANEVAIPLLEAWSGASASELSAAVGNKLQHSIGYTFFLKVASHLTHRAVSSGYSNEMPEHPNVWHVYPKGGAGTVCQRLADELVDEIQLESPVEAIWVEQERVKAIQVNGKEQPVSAVISTAPCPVLARLVKGTEALRPLEKFRYRPMAFVNLRLEGRGYLPDTVLWTPEAEFPFFRLTETPLSMPWLAPPGKTLITVDIGCEIGDGIWTMTDEALGEFCCEALRPIIPQIQRHYLGCRVLRSPIAYPVYLQEYEEDRCRFEKSTGIAGLYSIGRNGEFSHLLMEDIYWRTQKQMREVRMALSGYAASSGQDYADDLLEKIPA